MKAFFALFMTEAKLAARGGDMIVFGLAFPIAIMLLLGFISSPDAVRLGFAGVATVGVCAAGLMGIPLTFAGYRHEKILKRYRVTPVSPVVLLSADALLQTLFAWVSGAAVYLIARFAFGITLSCSALRYALTFAFVQVSIFSLGFLIASLAPNVKTANWVCTLAYFPMLFLSGATVPYEVLPKGVQSFAAAFPLTQGIKLLKGAALGNDISGDFARIVALAGVAAVSYAVSLIAFRWE